MAQVTVYVPDDLRAQAKEAGLKLSPLLQAAIRAALGLMPPTEHEKAQKQALQEIVTCPHPAKERTSYGICRLCKQKVS